eukprot:Pgem_evm1s10613
MVWSQNYTNVTEFYSDHIMAMVKQGRRGQSNETLVNNIFDFYRKYDIVDQARFKNKTEAEKQVESAKELWWVASAIRIFLPETAQSELNQQLKANNINKNNIQEPTQNKRFEELSRLIARESDANFAKMSGKRTSESHDRSSEKKREKRDHKDYKSTKDHKSTVHLECKACGKKAGEKHHKKYDCKQQSKKESEASLDYHIRKLRKEQKANH